MKFSTLRKAFIVLALMIAVAIPVCALSGSGTSSDPYQVATLDDLKAVTGSGYYKQTADIVINDISAFTFTDGEVSACSGTAWTPADFSGTYDGNGKYITGLYVKSSSALGGLFGTLTNATIKNVYLDFALVEADECAGILAAKANGTTTITDCVVSGSVIGKTTKTQNTVGGIVGSIAKGATVSECASYATVTGATSYSANVGGVAGVNDGSVYASAFNGKVYGTATYYSVAIGGLVGYNTGTVEESRAEGTVGGESTAQVNDCYVGGVAGVNKGELIYCINDAAVSVMNYSSADSICAAGGIAGTTLDANISDCANNGDVSGEYAYCGGIAGTAVADSDVYSINYCDNTGDISSLYGVAGGIAGRAVAAGEGYVSIKLNVNYCYNGGSVTGNATGELVGETATVDSASVNVGSESSKNNPEIYAIATSAITAASEQYGQNITATGIGTMSTAATSVSGKYIVRFSGNSSAFAPKPVIVTLTLVSDANKVEIISVDGSGLTLSNGTLSGTVVVKVYTPDADTSVQAVVGTSVGNKYADTQFENVDASKRLATLTITVNTVVEGLETTVTGPITVNALVVGTTGAMDPVCENMEYTK